MDLDGLAGHPGGGLRREQLGHRPFRGIRAAVVYARRGAVGKEPGSVHLGGHVGDHPLDGLQGRDRLAELDPLLRVGDRRVQRGLGYAQRLRGDADPPAIEGLHRDLEAVALPAQQRVLRDTAVGEVQGRSAGTADPQLVLGLADGEPGGVLLDDERAHPARSLRRIGLREDDIDLGVRGVGDEDLRSVENVLVPAPHRRGGASAGIGARGGLGQGESAQAAAGRHVMKVPVLLGLGSELEDRPGGKRGVSRHDDGGGRARPRDFLKRDYVAHVIRPGATHFLGVGHAHEIKGRHLRDDLAGKAVITVDLGRDRRQLGLGELPYRLPDQLLLIGQLEVHVRAPPECPPSRPG